MMPNPFEAALAKAIGKRGNVYLADRYVAPRRRTLRDRSSRPLPSKAFYQLVEGDEYLDWEEIDQLSPRSKSARRGRGTMGSTGTVLLEFERLAPSEITRFLVDKDKTLTPHRGLRRWNPEQRQLEEDAIPSERPKLLIVHGTFSNSESFFRSFQGTDHGKSFLENAVRKYRGEVYSFDHPTLSVSPWINAYDLNQLLPAKGTIDIVAHSRGGLVARWWNQLFDPKGDRTGKIIFVGSPLGGTGLAAPPNIRNVLRQLTSFGKALTLSTRWASVAVPCLSVVHVLLQVLTTMTSLAAHSPVADAAIALIPGLFGQSRVGNNPELLRLLQTPGPSTDRFHAILSDFESDAIGWQFWRAFRKDYLADQASDWIFEGPNDLVVDTDSMTQIGQNVVLPSKRCLDFGRNSEVHHINYFEFEKTNRFLADVLGF